MRGVPLGGLGAGSVELRGDGSLREWQIFNNWGQHLDLPNVFFSVWAREHGGKGAARVLELTPRYNVPGVDKVSYKGVFPFVFLNYTMDDFPIKLSLESIFTLYPSRQSALRPTGLPPPFSRHPPDRYLRAPSVAAADVSEKACQQHCRSGFGHEHIFESVDKTNLLLARLEIKRHA